VNSAHTSSLINKWISKSSHLHQFTFTTFECNIFVYLYQSILYNLW